MLFLNQLLLTLHNLTRWALIIMAVIVLFQALQGWLNKKTYTDKNKKLAAIYSGFFDLQILLGVILFFSQGWSSALMNGGSEVMSTATVRFFAVEHWMLMLLAVIIMHIGSSKVKKSETDLKKFRLTFIWFGVSLLLVLAAIPWPGMAAARPLLRIFGLSF